MNALRPRAAVVTVFASLALVASTACATTGSGRPATEARDHRDFRGVRVAGPVDATITLGRDFAVRVVCDDNLLPLVRTHLEADILVVDVDKSRIQPKGPCTVEIGAPSLASVALAGSGDVKVTGPANGLERISTTGSGDISIAEVAATALHLAVGGSGTARIGHVAAAGIDVDVNGSGEATVGGEAKTVRVRASGSGGVDLRALRAEAGDVRSSGASDVVVSLSRQARVRADGAGDVRVAGHPGERDIASTGPGTITFE